MATGSFIQVCREVVKAKQYRHFRGEVVDLFTASVVLQVFDALNPTNQTSAERMDHRSFAAFALSRVG